MNFRKISDEDRILENKEAYAHIDEEEVELLPLRRGRTRWPSQLPNLVRLQAQGHRADVTFDEHGVQIGRAGPHFINFLGVLCGARY